MAELLPLARRQLPPAGPRLVRFEQVAKTLEERSRNTRKG